MSYHAQYDAYHLLNDNEKWAFDGMIEAIANAETSVTLPTRDLSSLSNSEITQLFSNAWAAIRFDHPEFVWMTKGYGNNNDYERWDGYDEQTKFVVQFSYNELADNPELHQKEFEDAAERFLNRVRQEGSILAMEQYIFEYFKTSVKYENSSLDQTAYAALVNKRTVCAGVTLAVNYIFKRLGIPSYYLIGNTSGGSHAWNAVKIDGNWYYLDATPATDNTLTQNSYNSYFNVPYGQEFWATVDYDTFPASRFN